MNDHWSSAHAAPACGVLPPHILSAIAVRGDAEQREHAMRTLQVDHSVRAARIAMATRHPAYALLARRLGQRIVPWLAPAAAEPERKIYDAQNAQRLPGVPARLEGEAPTGDAATDEAYDGAGHTFDFYRDVYGRDSIDDAGMPLVSSVHFGRDYDNAFWNGRQMVYGDGDGRQFNRFTIDVDVMAHEMTHGVTEREAGLIYWAQAGALNESISDVFGSLVKQFTDNETAEEADWLIGEHLFTDQVNGVAIRSMKAPGTAYDDPVLGKDPQPADMDHYVRTLEDNGGVHINSGIPNNAFYRAAVAIGGHAWEVAGLIWYQTVLSPRLRRTAQFTAFARLTVLTAGQLFPDQPDTAAAVRDAWSEVGIKV